MPKRFKNIYQLKITLEEIEPHIWRRIQIPESYSFWDLHVAIQDAMGWHHCHLFQFEMIDPRSGEKVLIGSPDESGIGDSLDAGWDVAISEFFSHENPQASYLYDFGDSWEHHVGLEDILPRKPKTRYPCCLDGQRKCPPEDCGGVPGYEDLLEAISNTDHSEHEEMLEWVGGEFDPDEFDLEKRSKLS